MSQTASPGIRAYRESINLEVAPLVAELRDMLGAKLVAYLAGVGETRAVRQWAEGSRKMPAETEARLRLSYHVAGIIMESNSHRIAQTWFQGMNPQLEDRSPARLIRETNPDQSGPEVLAAARAFARLG
ncbi:hypothetical protein GCM10009636_32540 [Arthrobacter koreensis]|uniref:hypothetical protein n=1 Tax=Arthrobacter koreensis TaxID=199136 RepID=UPI0012643B11|nr:hypothetical protein [Arthrobacter koreensis]